MKRIAFLALALALWLSVAAAESVPSRTTFDMMRFEVTAEKLPEDAEFVLLPVNKPTVGVSTQAYQERIDLCQVEMNRLASSETAQDYFGQIRNENGELVSLAQLLGVEEVNVFEFCPAIADGYQAAYGKVTATMLFSTPYEEGEKVIVMIGLVTLNADGTQTVEWHPFEGIGLGAADGQAESEGCVHVELSPEIVEAIQNGLALLAVVSK